jgi:hypothetical protein
MDLKQLTAAELTSLDGKILQEMIEREAQQMEYLASLSTAELEDLREAVWQELQAREALEVGETSKQVV